MTRVLLDTNAYAAFCSGDRRMLDILAGAEAVYLSVIVLGELHAGFRGSGRREENERILGEFLAKPTVSSLLLTLDTAEIFGEIKDRLKRAGTPIPVNDLWLAAQAVETGSVLVSYDAHFRSVPGLRLCGS
ncbi:MAG: type II toxin-antitoxin system VapC family toxin [Elusimicrobia bacterium]|nr:type II toxin-antitoxin system VapC family toxin [Elusimicrobiota bacterium]